MNGKPIFVIGMERSGTKWLASILTQHPEICAPYCPEGGVFEPNFDSLGVFFEDLRPHDQFIGLSELIIKTDFYKALGLPLDAPYTWTIRPPNYMAYYGRLLETYTKIQGGKYWVQKSGIPSLSRIVDHYPSALYVCIRRNMLDNLRSKKAMALKEHGACQIFKMAILYKIEARQLSSLKQGSRHVIELDYESLRKESGEKIQLIHKALGIKPIEPQITVSENKGHSSFRSKEERNRILSQVDILKIRIGGVIGTIIPLTIWHWLRRLGPQKNRPIVRGAFLKIARDHGYVYENNDLK